MGHSPVVAWVYCSCNVGGSVSSCSICGSFASVAAWVGRSPIVAWVIHQLTDRPGACVVTDTLFKQNQEHNNYVVLHDQFRKCDWMKRTGIIANGNSSQGKNVYSLVYWWTVLSVVLKTHSRLKYERFLFGEDKTVHICLCSSNCHKTDFLSFFFQWKKIRLNSNMTRLTCLGFLKWFLAFFLAKTTSSSGNDVAWVAIAVQMAKQVGVKQQQLEESFLSVFQVQSLLQRDDGVCCCAFLIVCVCTCVRVCVSQRVSECVRACVSKWVCVC